MACCKNAGQEVLEEGSSEYRDWTEQCGAAQKVLETVLGSEADSYGVDEFEMFFLVTDCSECMARQTCARTRPYKKNK